MDFNNTMRYRIARRLPIYLPALISQRVRGIEFSHISHP
jgi:hypothetical protein